MSNRPPAKFVRYQLLGIIVAIGLNLMLMVLPVRAIDRAGCISASDRPPLRAGLAVAIHSICTPATCRVIPNSSIH